MLRVGQEAPDFTLPARPPDRSIRTGSRSTRTGAGRWFSFFYPFDFHPACTDQWWSLRDADGLTLLDDVVVLGVESDGTYAHREYADKHNIQFPLLSDTDGQVIQVLSILYFLPLAASSYKLFADSDVQPQTFWHFPTALTYGALSGWAALFITRRFFTPLPPGPLVRFHRCDY